MNPLPSQSFSPQAESPLAETPEVEEVLAETEASVESSTEDLDIDSIVASLATPEEEPAQALDGPPDFTKPEFAKLSTDFKEALGVDLKDAYENFTKIAEQNQQLVARIQEIEAQRTLSDLQTVWDVTPKELDRRVAKVLDVMNKMSPAQLEKYNSLEGVQQVWTSIESKLPVSKVAPSSGGQKPTTPVKRYKMSEIREMMMNNPTLYSQQQSALEAAFRDGLVDRNN